MAVKVLVTNIGQHIIADVKQVENKETKEVIAYWVKNPRVISYQLDEQKQVNVNFGMFCIVSNENEFSLRADHVVSILEPREDVTERYDEIVNPTETEVAELTPVVPTEEEANSLSGLLMNQLERMPAPGDIVLIDNFRLTIQDIEDLRVGQVIIERLPDDGETLELTENE